VCGEWDIVVLGPHFAAALVARDLGDTGPERSRRFEYAITHDRDLVIAAADSLMARIHPRLSGPVLPQRRPDALEAPATSSEVPADEPDVPEVAPELLGSPLLHRALSAAPTGITIADVSRPDHPLVWVNPAFTRMTGYDAREVLGQNCRFLQGPGTDAAAVGSIAGAVREGRSLRTTLLNYRRDGSPWWNDVRLSPVRDADGTVTHYIGIQTDVTRQVETDAHVLHLAQHDPLTGLPNRRHAVELIEQGLRRAEDDGTCVAVLFLDLDDFKRVNDEQGHIVGDDLLQLVARRLRMAAREPDVLARFGGDEFLLVLADLPRASAGGIARRIARSAREAVAEPFSVRGRQVGLGLSAGVALAPRDGTTADELVAAADAAMYADKRATG
jgi:diguanylate cyclase (GGDEF)-like protein/PAS domain S-box-containing protein